MLLENEHLGEYARTNEINNVYAADRNDENILGNNNNNDNINLINNDANEELITSGTTIENFYARQNIFITGGTGFLGKMLTEKLLRSCPDISTIYLLIRNKKDKNVEDRIEDLFNDSIYDRLREKMPKFRHKIVPISGDCSLEGLGISSTDRERLLREVSIVFHSAATVRFDERMDTALAINVGSTSDMIDLCQRMERLKAFIHVSTAYANCHVRKIEETFYSHPNKYEDLNSMIKGMDVREIENLSQKIIGEWPNTYTFTKALAEVVIREKSQNLNMGIFRPAIVISSAFEPIPGWIDNFYGPTGAVAAVANGFLKTLYCHHESKANIVPVDFTVNALIASAWDVATQPERRGENMLIYNYVSTVESPITWKEYCDINFTHAREFPLAEAKWTVSLTIHNYKLMDRISRIFFHYIPALFIDFFRICLGYEPILLKTYGKIHKFLNVVTWFCVNDWLFTNDNVQKLWQRLEWKDKKNFRFNIKDLNWNKYFRNYMIGVRIYLFKDDLSTLEASRKKMKRLTWIHGFLKIFFYASGILLLRKCALTIFS